MANKLRTALAAGSAIALGTGLSLLLSACTPTTEKVDQGKAVAASITISPDPSLYSDIPGGAPNATLDQAAAFAWQEFIAFNWPARVVVGPTIQGQPTAFVFRDQPATDCLFGDPKPSCAPRPLTWETFRGKAEIYSPAASGQNYLAPPQYDGIYSAGAVPACSASSAGSTTPAWVNLDETTEIDLNAMYSGSNPAVGTPQNSAPQLIRFAAKANAAEFNFYNPGQPVASPDNPLTLPTGTIEIKAGWRQLTADEAASGRFHTALVRYYEAVPGAPPLPTGQAQQCWNEATWGLVSLHIIQKTPTAPYFVYATFEQADNILTAGGERVEDEDGNMNFPPPASTTTPATTLLDTATPGGPTGPPGASLTDPAAGYCTPNVATIPPNQLYYQNEADTMAVPNGGYICINSRDHPIPQTIITANQQAHAAINSYNSANGIQSPWPFYKLINVQYVPLNNPNPGIPYAGPDVATYYQSNSVTETSTVLQNFSGAEVRVKGQRTGATSDWPSQFPSSPIQSGPVFYNVNLANPVAGRTQFNMGGCMGCHGNAQLKGSDFSFVLLFGDPKYPDAVPQNTSGGVQLSALRFRALGGPPGGEPPRRRGSGRH